MNFAHKIARRAQEIEASGIRKIFDLAATLKDPVNFSIGQPDFDVPEPAKNTAIEAIRKGFNRYTPSAGLPELRSAVLKRFETMHGQTLESALITSGVSGGLTLALLALIDPGDEVLLPDPYFVSYKHLTTMCGGVPVYYDTYPDFRIDAARLEKLITPKTKLLLTMSPGNPTGICLDERTKWQLADLARERGLIVLSDEIYDGFLYDEDGLTAKSLAAFYPEGTVVLGGLSKTAAMTGWRIGWALGPDVLIREMIKLQQFTFVCAPSFAQQSALTALHQDLTQTVATYKRKRDALCQGLRKTGYEVVLPDGAFYAFVNVPARYPCSQAFAEAAIKANLLVVPGNVFSSRDTHFRIAYAVDDAQLQKGLHILAALNA